MVYTLARRRTYRPRTTRTIRRYRSRAPRRPRRMMNRRPRLAPSSRTTKIRAPVIGRSCIVRLPYANSQTELTVPSPGSITLSLMGNSISPTATLGGVTLAAGQTLYQGLQAYVNLYRRYEILSSRIRVSIASKFSATPDNMDVCLGAFPYSSQLTPTILDALSIDEIKVQPGLQWKTLTGTSGSKSIVWFNSARNSRRLVGYKPDFQDGTTSQLGSPGFSLGGAGGLDPTPPDDGIQWFWYLRVFNNDATNDQIVDVSYKLMSTFRLFQQTIWDAPAVVA